MKARALLVGASDPQLEGLNLELQEAGFLTETATDGTDGLEVGYWFQPHLVVTETELDGISGFELCLRISSGDAGFSAKVIFYSQSYRDEKSRQATTRKYGAVAYFVKPFHKHVLLKTAIEILTNVDLEGRAQAVLPAPKARQDRKPQEFRWTPELLDAAISKDYSHLPQLQETVEQKLLPGNSGDLPPDDAELVSQAEVTTLAEVISSSVPSEQSPETDSALKENVVPAAALPEETQPELAAPEELEEEITRLIPDEAKDAGLPKRSLSRGAQILFAAAAAVLAVGLTVSLWLSRSLVLEVSPQASVPMPPAKDQVASLEEGKTQVPTAATALTQPSEPPKPPDPASEAMIRLLSSGRSTSTKANAPATAPRGQDVRNVSSASPELIISDVSRTDQQPFLTTMSLPSLSLDELKAMGNRSYVVSVELDQNGSVTNARLVSPAEGSFPPQILDTVRQWRFVPRDKTERGAWVKYFTFKARPPGS